MGVVAGASGVALASALALLAVGGNAGDELVVLTASSARDGVERAARDFERANPGTTVTISSGGSSALVRQAVAGAPADVLITADPARMADATEAVAGDPVVVGRSGLQLVVPRGNPGGVSGLSDMAAEDRVVVLCTREVPCGYAALAALDAADVTPAVDSYEASAARAVLRVALGEADATLAWAATVGRSEVEVVPVADLPTTAYPAAVLRQSEASDLAGSFVRYLASLEGGRALAAGGLDPA